MSGSNFNGLKYKDINIKLDTKNVVVYIFDGISIKKTYKFSRLIYDNIVDVLYDLEYKILSNNIFCKSYSKQVNEIITYLEYNQGLYDFTRS